MFNKYQAVFRSRWRAALWAAGVMLTAYCTVPSADGDDPTTAILNVAVNHAAKPAPPPQHVNPWAKGG
jgi:hypothetical protein